MLYNYFRRRFEERVEKFGRERMKAEIAELRNRTAEWYDYCVDRRYDDDNADEADIEGDNNGTISALANQRDNGINQRVKHLILKRPKDSQCWMLTAKELDFTKYVKLRQLRAYPGSVKISSRAYLDLLKEKYPFV